MSVLAGRLDGIHPAWTRAPGRYLNTASYGLPPDRAVDATLAWVVQWQLGAAALGDWLPPTDRARDLLGQLIGVDPDRLATGTSVSQLVGLVASSLRDGTLVVSAEDEFASLLHPFLAQADRGVRVETVPGDRLVDVASRRGDVIAFSLIRAADGRRADDAALVRAARERGAITVVDAAQALGWLDVDYTQFDVVVAPAFKWLCAPRGTAFMVVSPEHLSWLRPTGAGWWPSRAENRFFGGRLRLPTSAKRLDSSPTWTSWAGTAAALEVLVEIGVPTIADHVAALSSRLCAGLGMAHTEGAIIVLDARAAALLAAAGIPVTSTPAGTRVSFHLYNGPRDVDTLLEALS